MAHASVDACSFPVQVDVPPAILSSGDAGRKVPTHTSDGVWPESGVAEALSGFVGAASQERGPESHDFERVAEPSWKDWATHRDEAEKQVWA